LKIFILLSLFLSGVFVFSQENSDSIKFVALIKGELYNYPACRNTNKIIAFNLTSFKTIMEVSANGLCPCKVYESSEVNSSPTIKETQMLPTYKSYSGRCKATTKKRDSVYANSYCRLTVLLAAWVDFNE
jgi:hypothetical protein